MTRITRGECKTPGGKLVAVNVELDTDGHIASCHIDGDFFVEGADGDTDALLRDLERVLIDGESLRNALKNHPDARLVGTNAAAIETAFARALESAHRQSPSEDESGQAETGGDHSSQRIVANGEAAICDGGASHDTTMRNGIPRGGVPRGGADCGDDIECSADARWEALRRELVVIHDKPRSPQEQMTLDERWAREVASGTRPPTLRFWEWAAPCVVIGRFQSAPDEVNLDVARERGFAVVRRCTGGGAMFIEPGNTITYSLYAPMGFVGGISIEDSYRLCDQWLVRALGALGIDVRFSGLNDIASQTGKIGGAAQRRFPGMHVRGGFFGEPSETSRASNDAGVRDPSSIPHGSRAATSGGLCKATSNASGAILHHVTLAYDIDAAAMGQVLNTSREKLSDKAVKSAVKRVDPLKRQTGLTRDELVHYLIGEFGVPGC